MDFPESVFSLGNGLSSVEAWFSAALDIEEVLSGAVGDQLHVMVADVIKSFDTVDRSILDCALGRLGYLIGFERFIFLFIVRYVSGLGLLLDLVSHGVGMVVFFEGCPLSMIFIVALYVPWCRHLEALPEVKPQLYADNRKCSAERRRPCLNLLGSLPSMYGRSVRDVSPGKCVLLTTSRSVRRAMKLWGVAGDGVFWKVELGVRDLGGHLDLFHFEGWGRYVFQQGS